MSEKKEPEIEYPTDWNYKVIAVAETAGIDAEIIATAKKWKRVVKPILGNASKGGKYNTWNISCSVDSKEMLHGLGNDIGGIPGVKMVL